MKFAQALLRQLPPRLIYREGSALVPSYAAHAWPERMFLKRLLTRLDVDCVLDVGANVGQYASELRLIGFTGFMISFEPTPSSHAEMVRAAKSDSRWIPIGVALGEKSGSLALNIMASSDFNSFHQPSMAETGRLAPANKIVDTVDVQVETLDELLPKLQARYGFKRPFLKMDTQGHDIAVFDGARAVHDRIVGLQSEISVKRIYENTLRWSEAIHHYEEAGFDLAGLFAVNPGENDLCELDCFMVRR